MNVSVWESGSTPSRFPVARVLAADHAVGIDRPHRAEHLAALLDDRAAVERGRRLHRDEAEHVEQVRDDHVAVRAGVLVEAGAVLDRQGLGHVDLDVVDVVAVPDRLEHAVREPQREQVLHGLAAEEVVDAEDALLREDRVHERVELHGALQVHAERLLEHHPRACIEPGVAERLDRGAERAGRHRQVVQPARVVEVLLGLGDRVHQRLRVVGVERAEPEPGGEPVPDLAGGGLADRGLRDLAEVLHRPALARGPDDPVVAGHQPRAVEVEQARQQLAAGEVAECAEQHDHMVVGDGCAVRSGHLARSMAGRVLREVHGLGFH